MKIHLLFFRSFLSETLGTSKPKFSWQARTISMLLVWNSVIKNLFIVKSSDDNWDFLRVQASRPNSNSLHK